MPGQLDDPAEPDVRWLDVAAFLQVGERPRRLPVAEEGDAVGLGRRLDAHVLPHRRSSPRSARGREARRGSQRMGLGE